VPGTTTPPHPQADVGAGPDTELNPANRTGRSEPSHNPQAEQTEPLRVGDLVRAGSD
jgi:hypothetical protein